MKKYLVILFVGLIANNAMASRARLAALGLNRIDLTGVGYISDGTLLLKDNRNIFLNPAEVTQFHDEFSFELGQPDDFNALANTNPATGAYGEGGIMYDYHGGRLGFQLGRRSEITQTMGALRAAGATILPPKDAVDIIYGEKSGNAWGVGIHYAAGEQHNTGGLDNKSSEIILSGGMLKDKMEFFGQLGLNAKSENGTEVFNGRQYLKAGLAYQMDNVSKIIGTAASNGFDYTTPGGVKTENNNLRIDVRYARTHAPKKDIMFFYGGGLTMVSGDRTTAGNKVNITVNQLPMFLGIEGAATSWMDLRASVNQAIILNTTKNPNTGKAGDFQDDPNSTTIGAGTTLKFTNFTVDTTLQGATTGTINANSLLADAAIEYHF